MKTFFISKMIFRFLHYVCFLLLEHWRNPIRPGRAQKEFIRPGGQMTPFNFLSKKGATGMLFC